MKVGLIPPRGLEGYALESDFHLTLPIEETTTNREYMRVYGRAAARGDYIVLDNGAAEGAMVTTERLLEEARRFDADEIVAPDEMRNPTATTEAVRQFLSHLKRLEETTEMPTYKVMAVAQGTKMRHFEECVEDFSSSSRIDVLGIPRHMLKTLWLTSRCDLARWVEKEFPGRFEVHLLGANPLWMREISTVAREIPSVRSLDTSLPFTYALASIDLEQARHQFMRVKNYFTHDWFRVDPSLVQKNIQTYLKWAEGK